MRILLALLAVLAFSDCAMATDIRISWRVVQPFRFLRFESDQKIHQWALDEFLREHTSGTTDIVSGMEAKLNDPGWWARKPIGGTKTYGELFATLRQAEVPLGRPYIGFDPRLGWASMLRDNQKSSISGGTCWDAAKKDYSGCISQIGAIRGGNEYVFPVVHLVELSAETSDSGVWKPLAGACRLSVTNALKAGFGFIDDKLSRGRESGTVASDDCSGKFYLRVQYPETYQVELTSAAATVVEAIKVEDMLIAGIGDSFAAGEGNPELPAVLDSRQGLMPYTSVVNNTEGMQDWHVRVPVRLLQNNGSGKGIAADSQAKWLDQQCHRSAYGPQYRAALAIALYGQRHHAVTFVSYACSGAEITDGLFWPQDHRECMPATHPDDRLHQPQISGLVRTLSLSTAKTSFRNSLASRDRFLRPGNQEYLSRMGKCASWRGNLNFRRDPALNTGKLKRKIDILMVGIGGNDIGFSALVTRIVINSHLLDADFGWLSDVAVIFYRKIAGAITLGEVDERLSYVANRYDMLARAITQKLEIDQPNRVLVAGYPDFTRNENGRYCPGGNKGMNVSKLLSVQADRSRFGAVIPEDGDLKRRMLNRIISDQASRRGWQYVSTMTNGSDLFASHGYCAMRNRPASPTSEIFDVPHERSAWEKVDGVAYNPATDFYPYVSRQRWVRTFNDSYLISFYFKENPIGLPLRTDQNAIYLATRALGGPMHLTAEGYAHMADRLYASAIGVLFDTATGLPKAP